MVVSSRAALRTWLSGLEAVVAGDAQADAGVAASIDFGAKLEKVDGHTGGVDNIVVGSVGELGVLHHDPSGPQGQEVDVKLHDPSLVVAGDGIGVLHLVPNWHLVFLRRYHFRN